MRRSQTAAARRRAAAVAVDWDERFGMLLLRSGERCEARSPACLAGPDGELGGLPRWRVSVQHRRARGMGGSRAGDTHSLANLLVVCGDGVAGCHGWIECGERALARERGLWVPQSLDPATVPVILRSGRTVLLDPHGPVYVDVGWSTTVPGIDPEPHVA